MSASAAAAAAGPIKIGAVQVALFDCVWTSDGGDALATLHQCKHGQQLLYTESPPLSALGPATGALVAV